MKIRGPWQLGNQVWALALGLMGAAWATAGGWPGVILGVPVLIGAVLICFRTAISNVDISKSRIRHRSLACQRIVDCSQIDRVVIGTLQAAFGPSQVPIVVLKDGSWLMLEILHGYSWRKVNQRVAYTCVRIGGFLGVDVEVDSVQRVDGKILN